MNYFQLKLNKKIAIKFVEILRIQLQIKLNWKNWWIISDTAY